MQFKDNVLKYNATTFKNLENKLNNDEIKYSFQLTETDKDLKRVNEAVKVESYVPTYENNLIELPSKLKLLGFTEGLIDELKKSVEAEEQNYEDIINGFKDENFKETLKNLNQAIGKKLSSYTRGKMIWDRQTPQQRKFAFLNKVKDEIGKIPQGKLMSEDNIKKLKITIVVWKILSMTPVKDMLPDKILRNSINVLEPDKDSDTNFTTHYLFNEDNIKKNLDAMMNVFYDYDEKELYFTGKYRLGNGEPDEFV